MEHLTADEGSLALSYARMILENHVRGTPYTEPSWPSAFSQKRGVFVTLTKHGDLRGCIGFPYAVLPLKEAIRDAARSAASEDPRFPPVRGDELTAISVEVTILTEPELLTVPPHDRENAIVIGRDGLIIKGYGRSGLLLPQVPVEWGWDIREFLDHTCMKAGLPAKSWLEAAVQVFTFEGQIFNEKSD
ncbi:MAG: TIGR00296 family protein [Methanobacteriota archaeon]